MTVSVFRSSKFKDIRGELFTSYDKADIKLDFVIDKVSVSTRGTIRGFHGDNETWKLVSCMSGIFKLAVYDIYHKTLEEFILDEFDDQFTSILIPPYHLNAHQCLSERCVLHYKWSEYYNLDSQYSVKYNDEFINCKWMDLPPILSDRDLNSLGFKECFP